jgi:thiol-disulfide isomerase/thioredoxin
MMKKILILLTIFFALMHSVYAQSPTIKPYQKGDWKALTKPYAGQAIAIHFWGVTCAPCAKEMPQWGQFLTQNKNAKMIFIQVDDVSPESAVKMLSTANVNPTNSYTLTAPFDEALRHEIDPQWRGETPMTLLVDKNGKVTRKVGSMDFKKLKQWYLSGA